jgi:hypothetical protein
MEINRMEVIEFSTFKDRLKKGFYKPDGEVQVGGEETDDEDDGTDDPLITIKLYYERFVFRSLLFSSSLTEK